MTTTDADSPHAAAALADMCQTIGIDQTVGGTLRLVGFDLPRLGCHRLASTAGAALGTQALAVAQLWRLRGGPMQDIRVELARAVQALRCHVYSRKNGYQLPVDKGPMSGFHRTADNRWICVYASHTLSRFLDASLDVLGCTHDAASIANAVARWQSGDLESALNERGVPAATARTHVEWQVHPQGRWLAAQPVVDIEQIGDAEPEGLPPGARPLSGVRVLDITHAICGPMVSRAFAEHGADVLRVAPPNCNDPEAIVIDTGWGKRNCYLDFDDPRDLDAVRRLVRQADVVVRSFRPGALERRGLAAQELVAMRPGLVCVGVSGYGDGGPWARRGAYEALGQSVAGLCDEETYGGRPRVVRTGTLNDYLGAYLAGAGAMSCLARRITTGGSYRVRVSLARTSMWVRGQGLMPEAAEFLGEPYADPIEPALRQAPSAFGVVTALGSPIDYSHTPTSFDIAPSPLGSSPAVWLER